MSLQHTLYQQYAEPEPEPVEPFTPAGPHSVYLAIPQIPCETCGLFLPVLVRQVEGTYLKLPQLCPSCDSGNLGGQS